MASVADKKKRIQTLLLIIVGVSLIGVSGWKICSILVGLHNAKELYEDTLDDYVIINSAMTDGNVVILDGNNAGNGQDEEGTSAGNMSDSNNGNSSSAGENSNLGNGNLGINDISTSDIGGGINSNMGISGNGIAVPWYEIASVDIAALRAVNSDICGWIMFENESISYPILKGATNDTYIRTTYDYKSATAGSIFMEQFNDADFSDDHTIIYGHNMMNLTMFGKLKYYSNKSGYYEGHRYFQIFTEDRIYRYEIFAYKSVDPYSSVYSICRDGIFYQAGLAGEINSLAAKSGVASDMNDFISNQLIAGNECGVGVTMPENPKIITLSTCSGKTNRQIVCAVRVDEYIR